MEDKEIRFRSIAAARKFLEHRDYEVLSEGELDDLEGTPYIFARDNDEDELVLTVVRWSTEELPPDEMPERRLLETAAARELVELEPGEGITVRFDAVDMHILGENRAFLRHHIRISSMV